MACGYVAAEVDPDALATRFVPIAKLSRPIAGEVRSLEQSEATPPRDYAVALEYRLRQRGKTGRSNRLGHTEPKQTFSKRRRRRTRGAAAGSACNSGE